MWKEGQVPSSSREMKCGGIRGFVGGGDGAAPVQEVWVVRSSPRIFVLVFGFCIRGTTEGIRGKRKRKGKVEVGGFFFTS